MPSLYALKPWYTRRLSGVIRGASHADTAALLATLPALRRPVAVAAADYWFTVRWRRILLQTLIAGLPVRRTGSGGYASLLAAAAPPLGRGQHVILFPEGTRSEDGTLGEFRSGAVRLAKDCGVPIVPVALVGTGEILPKNGRIRPQPVEVRVGRPIAAAELADGADGAGTLRAEIQALRDQGPADIPASPVWRRVTRFAGGRLLLPVAFMWGLAEAVSWPIVVEMFLAFFVVCLPRRVLPAAAALAAGSVAGVVLHAYAVRHGVTFPLPVTTPHMVDQATIDLQTQGARGIRAQPVNGIPVKVYAQQAGLLAVELPALAWHAALARGARILTVGAVLTGAAWVLSNLLRRWYGWYVLAATCLFVVLLRLVVQQWA